MSVLTHSRSRNATAPWKRPLRKTQTPRTSRNVSVDVSPRTERPFIE